MGDFVRRLERTFQITYGRDGTLPETRDALLYSQLQEGLSHRIMEAPAVSGAADYQALGLTAKNEEHRQAALRTRQSYHQTVPPAHRHNLRREPPILRELQ